jgi:hypothetical protein
VCRSEDHNSHVLLFRQQWSPYSLRSRHAFAYLRSAPINIEAWRLWRRHGEGVGPGTYHVHICCSRQQSRCFSSLVTTAPNFPTVRNGRASWMPPYLSCCLYLYDVRGPKKASENRRASRVYNALKSNKFMYFGLLTRLTYCPGIDISIRQWVLQYFDRHSMRSASRYVYMSTTFKLID